MLLIPQIGIVESSFHSYIHPEKGYTLENYLYLFNSQGLLRVFRRTIVAAIFTTAFTLVACYPIAYYIAKKARKRMQITFLIMLMIPFYVSELMRVYAWCILLGDQGVINYFLMKLNIIDEPIKLLYTSFSVYLGLIYVYILFMIFPLYSVLTELDDSLLEAASDLGAGKLYTFFRVVLPFSAPGITSGCIMVFMLTVGTLSVPSILGGANVLWFIEIIYSNFFWEKNWNLGATNAIMLVLASIAVVYILLRVSRQRVGEVIE
ncbi:MAG: ABC transporter permease [Spirochaetota bacterium]